MSTKYLAAYALASLAKANPTAADIEAIFKAVNVPVEKDTLSFVMDSVNGRDVSTLISEGASKMSAVCAPAGGAAASAAAPAAGGAADNKAGKKEEKKVEEEEDDEMGFGLFD